VRGHVALVGIGSDNFARDKYGFMDNTNKALTFNAYIDSVIPTRAQVDLCGFLTQEPLFDHYLNRAITLTRQMWREVLNYLQAPYRERDEDLMYAKSFFPNLRRHWNLDTGIRPGLARSKAYMFHPKDIQNREIHERLVVLAGIIFKNYTEERIKGHTFNRAAVSSISDRLFD
jgi:hypothetical protein